MHEKDFFVDNMAEMLKFVEETPTTLLMEEFLTMLMEYMEPSGKRKKAAKQLTNSCLVAFSSIFHFLKTIELSGLIVCALTSMTYHS